MSRRDKRAATTSTPSPSPLHVVALTVMVLLLPPLYNIGRSNDLRGKKSRPSAHSADRVAAIYLQIISNDVPFVCSGPDAVMMIIIVWW